MAVIGTIRNRMGIFLVIFVGLALVAFILGGLFNTGRSVFSGSSNDVAKIGGETVTVQEFEQKVQQMTDVYKQRNNTDNIDNNTMDQIRDQVWNQMLNEMLFGKEFEKLGISVSSEELFDMVQGKNIHPSVRQAFTDPKTGEFSTASIIRFLKNLDNTDEATKTQWLNFEKQLKEERLLQKYNNLIAQSFYTTTQQAKEDYLAKNRMAKISFVMKPFSAISDSSVKLSDSELKDYYEEHKNEYKQEDSRKIEYVAYDVQPSEIDKKEVLDEINALVPEFKESKDDSAFVRQHSDQKTEPAYYKKGTLSPLLDTAVFTASAGQVIGPVLDNGVYKLAKVEGSKTLPDSVKARHILLPLAKPEDKDKVMARADSIKKAIKGGSKFEEIAKKMSTDQGSAQKGGDLGWFAEGMMVKPFNDACFEGKKGDMPVVQSQFGVHIIEVLDQKLPAKRVKVAIVERKLEASSKTFQGIYGKASELASNLNGGVDFDATISKKGLSKREADIHEVDRQVQGIDNSREIVRWAYKAKEGETSKVFETGNKFIVAKLSQVREKGIATFDQMKEQIKPVAVREKKAKEMMEKLDQQLNGATNIAAIASKSGLAIQSGDNVNFYSAGIGGVGREPQIVGHIFAMKKGQLSKALKGSNGVFVVQVEDIIEPAPKQDFKAEKMQISGTSKQLANYQLYNCLKEKAKVEDNRIRFY